MRCKSLVSVVVLTLLSLVLAPPATAVLVVDSTSYSYPTQTFDSLTDSVTSMNWLNDSTIAGWSLFRVASTALGETAPVPIRRYEISNGSADTGRFYSYGDGADRALGSLGRNPFGDGASAPTQVSVAIGTVAGWIAVSFINQSGSTLNQFDVDYRGEQWRVATDNEPAVKQTMFLEYGFGATFATVPAWTRPADSNFHFESPQLAPFGSAIDGNTAGHVDNLGGTITGLSWANGQQLWVRFVESNDSGTDHGLAIDDFSFSVGATAVPEPGAAFFGNVVCALIAVIVTICPAFRGLNQVRVREIENNLKTH